MIKQVIVVRSDLKMPKGKIAAQASHASMGALLNPRDKNLYPTRYEYSCDLNGVDIGTLKIRGIDRSARSWLEGDFTKICLKTDSEESLVELAYACEVKCIRHYLITDNGETVFNGVPTKTCLAIGPDESDVIDLLTGHLRLL